MQNRFIWLLEPKAESKVESNVFSDGEGDLKPKGGLKKDGEEKGIEKEKEKEKEEKENQVEKKRRWRRKRKKKKRRRTVAPRTSRRRPPPLPPLKRHFFNIL